MKIYGAHPSPYFERVWLQLILKDVLDKVDYPGLPTGFRTPEHFAQNPMGRIPYLELDDGRFLPESQIICDYLERKFPKPALKPANPEQAAQVDLIIRLLDLYTMPHAVKIAQSMAKPGSESQVIEAHGGQLEAGLTYVEHFIRPEKRAVGNDWTLADCALIPLIFYLNLIRSTQNRDFLANFDRLGNYAKSIGRTDLARETFDRMQKALEALIAARQSGQAAQ